MSKKLFVGLFLVVLLITLSSFSAIAAEKNPNDLVNVLVRMNGKLNLRAHNGTPGEIKKLLIEEADRSQKDLIKFLSSVKRNGESVDYESIWIINAIKLRAPESVIRMLNNRPDVKEILEDKVINLPIIMDGKEVESKGNAEWNIEQVKAPEVWKEYGFTGKGVKIGHIDSGCDGNHPDLKGKIYAWKDFSANSEVPIDENSHGTHSLGTIIGGNSSGKYIGVAPDAKVAVARVFSASGSTNNSTILKAMEWIMDPDGNPDTDDAPRLVSNSWGDSGNSRACWDAVTAWVQAGIFPCFAAGNSGPGSSTMGSPGSFPQSFAVGATDRKDKIASFSSRGPVTWDGKEIIKPDVSAPGYNIKSSLPGGRWGVKSGTSMACPNVAGCITLMYQADPTLDIPTIRRLLEENSLDLGDAGKDNVFGAGRVNILKVIDQIVHGGKIAGMITDVKGNPIKNAVIQIKNGINVKSNKSGKFNISIKEGTYKVTISAFGYLPVIKSIKVVKKETTTINVELKNAPTTSLTGLVMEKNSGTLLSATVTIVGVDVKPAVTDPKTGKFAFVIPAGIYNLKITSFQHETMNKKVEVKEDGLSITFELNKLPPILLVNDSKTDYITYYTRAIEEAGYKYSFVNSSKDLTTDYLIQYPVVVWFTGKDSSFAIDKNEQAYLTTYLKSGGNLLLTGQDIGYSLKNNKFYTEMLKSKYLEDNSGIKSIKGVLAPFKDMEFDISGGDGANNQSYPDVVEALSPAKLVLKYSKNGETTGAAVLYENKVYKVIYLGFGFEAISKSELRAKFMKRSIEYLLPKMKDKFNKIMAMDEKTHQNREYSELSKKYGDRILYNINEELKSGNRTTLNSFMREFENNRESSILRYMGIEVKKILMNKSEKYKSELKTIDELLK